MSDGRTQDGQRLPWPETVEDENGEHGDLAEKVLWALFALLLMSSVAGVSYLTGLASRQEPIDLESNALPVARRAAPTLPQLEPPPPSEMEAPPPVVRMLEAQSGTESAVPEIRVKKQSISPATKGDPAPLAPKFRPPRRVLVARRAIARRAPVRPRPVVYASRVVQLGEYSNWRQAAAAHTRLVRVYPYLKTLPRTIKSAGPRRANGRAYQLRVTAYSPEYARVLCQNLLSIGRGCAVLPEPA